MTEEIKKNKPLYIIIAVLAVLAIGGIGFSIYYGTARNVPDITESDFNSIKDELNSVKDALDKVNDRNRQLENDVLEMQTINEELTRLNEQSVDQLASIKDLNKNMQTTISQMEQNNLTKIIAEISRRIGELAK